MIAQKCIVVNTDYCVVLVSNGVRGNTRQDPPVAARQTGHRRGHRTSIERGECRAFERGSKAAPFRFERDAASAYPFALNGVPPIHRRAISNRQSGDWRPQVIRMRFQALTCGAHASMLIACRSWFRSGMYLPTCIASSRLARRSKACPSRTTCCANYAKPWTVPLLTKCGSGFRAARQCGRIPRRQPRCAPRGRAADRRRRIRPS